MRPIADLPVFVVLCLPACSAPNQVASAPCTPCQQSAQAAPAATAAPRSERLDGLGQLRVDLARKRIDVLRLMYDRGATSLDELCSAYRDVAFAARDSGLRGDALRRPLEEYRTLMLQLREVTRGRVQTGRANETDLDRIESAVAEAEYWVAESNEKR